MSKNTMLQTRASSHVPVDLDDELAQSRPRLAHIGAPRSNDIMSSTHQEAHKSLHNAL